MEGRSDRYTEGMTVWLINKRKDGLTVRQMEGQSDRYTDGKTVWQIYHTDGRTVWQIADVPSLLSVRPSFDLYNSVRPSFHLYNCQIVLPSVYICQTEKCTDGRTDRNLTDYLYLNTIDSPTFLCVQRKRGGRETIT